MQVRNFVGKRACLDEVVAMAGADCFYEAGDYDETFAVAVVALTDFKCEMTDRFGNTDYSLSIYLDEDRIVSLERVAHVHMCGGQGMDDELRRFPHTSLEQEADDKLKKILSKRSSR
jgi:hypothetical protein